MEKKTTDRVTQQSQVLAYLKHGMRITQRQAARWNIWRLADVVFKLRADGWNIKTTMRSNKGAGSHAEYHLGRPYTFKGRRVKAIKGDGSFFRKGAEGTIVSVAVDGDYLVKFDKGWYRRDHKQEGHRWASPAHFKLIKGGK